MSGCPCQIGTPPGLVADVYGDHLPAIPAESHGPMSVLFRSFCARCGAEYNGAYRLLAPVHRANSTRPIVLTGVVKAWRRAAA